MARSAHPVIQDLSHRMTERVSLKMEVVVAAMRLLRMAYGVLKNQLGVLPTHPTTFLYKNIILEEPHR